MNILRLHMAEPAVKTGEIFPKDTAAVAVQPGNAPAIVAAQWGFPMQKGKLLINSRAETAAQKPLFSSLLQTGRCAVPSSGFFEWSHDEKKQKYLFDDGTDHLLYMAGLWRPGAAGREFVILTTAANASMRETHDRMPLILPREFVRVWLADTQKATQYLSAAMPQLQKRAV